VHRKAEGRGVEVADAQKVRRAFAQVDDHIQNIVKVFKHNAEVVQVGFYKNDIWLETFKLVLEDLARNCVIFGDPDVALGQTAENVGINWQHYWDKASAIIGKAVSTEQEKKAEEPDKRIIERLDDETPIEFGGDYASTESAEAGQAAP
jgi:hypothetical protein